MISMRLWRLYFRLLYSTGFRRISAPEYRALFLLFQGVPEPVGAIPTIFQHPLCYRKTAQQHRDRAAITHLSRNHKRAQRSSVLIRDRMQLRVRAAFYLPGQAAWIPFFNRRLEAVRCALRYVASIMMVRGSAFAAGRPSIIYMKMLMPPQRLQRLYSVLCGAYSRGASRQRRPLRFTKMIPLNTRRSSTRGLPWLFGKKGRRRSICSSVSQNKSLISSLLAEPESDLRNQINGS